MSVYVEFKTLCGCVRCMELEEFPGPTWQLPLAVPVTHGNEDPRNCTAYVRVRTFEHERDRISVMGDEGVTVHVYREKLEEGCPPPEPVILRSRCGSVQLMMWSNEGTYEIKVPMYPDDWTGLGPAPEKTGSRTFKYKGEAATLFRLTCKVFEEVQCLG